MTLKVKGVEIELPNGATVDISEDGAKVKISGLPASEPEVVEKIRIVEVAGPETIRYVPSYQYYTWPNNPWTGTTPSNPNWSWCGTTGTLTSSVFTIGSGRNDEDADNGCVLN